MSNPGNLDFYWYAPSHLKKDTARPLVIVLHGCTQTAAGIANLSDWNNLSDRYGFYVLYPQQKITNNISGCFNWFRKHDIIKDRGEVATIKNKIDEIMTDYFIDTNQLFVYGLSAGASMSVALLANYPSFFNAGAILAGGAYSSDYNVLKGMLSMSQPKELSSSTLASAVKDQNPRYSGIYPRVVIIHGKQDGVVDIRNAYQVIQQWTCLHETDTIPNDTIRSFHGNKDITKYIFENVNQEAVVMFYEVDNLGHTLMIDPGDGLEQGGNKGVYATDKDFFSTYWIARDFGIVKE